MKIVLLIAVLFASHSAAFAGVQQDKMKTCNAAAKGKKGEERKAFMKSCLTTKLADSSNGADAVTSSASEADAQIPAVKSADPKQRMRDCNQQSAGKKGDERKAFMSSCLKN